MADEIAPPSDALQQRPGPRPLPLFLELVRRVGLADPELASAALKGLAAYQRSGRTRDGTTRRVIGEVLGVSLRDCGGSGPPIVLVPSLINPPEVLDLRCGPSLAEWLTSAGRVHLVDWGAARDRSALDVAGHVTERLQPLLALLDEPPVLIGYCLGGTMALAAAGVAEVRGVATLAAPWRFAAYPPQAITSLQRLWEEAHPSAEQLGMLPIEVLQTAFWSLDPKRVVAKYARVADLALDGDEFRRFVALEDWANSGEPLPAPAAAELIERLFGADVTGRGEWLGGGLPACPTLHVTAASDTIVPSATVAPLGEQLHLASGHVGMVVGRSAPEKLYEPLRQWVEALPPHR